LKAAILAAGLSMLLFLGNRFVPVFGSAMSLLSPAPLVWLYRRFGMGAGRLSVLAAMVGMPVVSLVLFEGGAFGLSFLYPALISLGLGETLTRGHSEDRAVAMGMAGGLLALAALTFSMAWSQGLGVVELLERTLNALIAILVKVQEAQPGAEPEVLAAFEQNLREIGRMLLNLGMGIVTVGSMMLAWLNLLVSRRGLPPGTQRPTLMHWRSPEPLVWVFIAGAAAALLLEGWWKWAGANVALILAAVYLLQGLAVIGYYFDKKQVPRFVRAAAYAAIAILEFLLPVVAAVGFFDLWLNFRRMGKPKSA
jgi:uncharacterized protein YybS (DUF2232 family)